MDDLHRNRRTVPHGRPGSERRHQSRPQAGRLNDYEVCRYMRLENGLSADVYSLEIIIPIAFRLNTYHAHVFRTWLVGKALSKEKRQAYVMFIQNGKAGIAKHA